MAVRSCRSATLRWATALLLVAQAATADPDVLERARDLRVENPQAALALLDDHIVEPDSIDASDGNAEQAHEQVRLLELRARIRRDTGQHEDAAADAVRLERIAEMLDEPVRLARAQFMHGTIQAERGDIAGALERFHAARRTLEATDETVELARVTNALGVAHNFTGDHARARDYYAQALEIVRQTDDNALENSILGNLALVIAELEGPEAGLAAHREALALARERGDAETAANQLANICNRLVEAERLGQATTTCREALEQVEKLGNTRLIAGTRMSLGDLERARNRPEEALQNYQAALALAENLVPSVEVEVLEKLARVHEALDEPWRALDRLRQLMELRKELLERERASLVEELEVRYRVEQQEREIELLELDRALQNAKLRQRSLLLIGAAIALVLVTLLLLVAWRGFTVKSHLERELAQRNSELVEALDTITRLAREDSLTGLLNRRGFHELAQREIRRSHRTGEPLSLVMADIDEFKQLNDRHGHTVGDEILRRISRRMEQSIRDHDIVCRWGGEEFVFLLPRTDPTEARQVIERVRSQVVASPIATEAGAFPVTLTFGIAVVE
ncbi:MAG: diguanylate cyclase, partial [Wenzhouxiangellaceae bacterium]